MSDTLWVERYRPKNLGEVEHHEDVKFLLSSVKKNWKLPNLLFYGPSGTGKSSVVLAFAREVFGVAALKSRLLELNASDERGIDMIRERVKTWSRLMSSSGISEGEENTDKFPPWKIIVLDEADMMTPDAQSALRRVMEDTSKHTRFVIICNYISKIIDPLASRCVKFRFRSIPLETQMKRLKAIREDESINVSDEALLALTKISKGDLRLAINLLQSVCMGGIASSTEVTINDIEMVSGLPPRALGEEILNRCASGLEIESLIQLSDKIRHQGWDMNSLLEALGLMILSCADISDECKAKLAFKLADSQEMLHEGASETLICQHVLWEISSEIKTARHLRE